MATQYPSGIDTFVNPTSQNTQNAPSHAQQHADENDAIHAIETALGQNPQATATDVAARIAATETVADAAVPQTRTVAGHALTGDVTLAAADVGARPDDWQPASTDITDATATGRALVTAADAAAVRSVAALPAHPTGHGSPEGLVTAPPGTLYTDLDGTNGAWTWVKTSGTGATGWVANFDTTFVDNLLDSVASAVTLDSIAGTPAGLQSGSGGAAIPGFDQYGDRSLYAVIDVIADGGAFNTVARLGSNTSTGNLIVQAIPGGSTRLGGRSAGGTDVFPVVTSNTGRIAVVVYMRSGCTAIGAAVLGGGHVESNALPASGMETTPDFRLYSFAGVASGIYAATYPAVHTVYQRDMIMRKLLQMSEA